MAATVRTPASAGGIYGLKMDAIFAEYTIGVTELRESPSRVLKQAKDSDEAVAILRITTNRQAISSSRA